MADMNPKTGLYYTCIFQNYAYPHLTGYADSIDCTTNLIVMVSEWILPHALCLQRERQCLPHVLPVTTQGSKMGWNCAWTCTCRCWHPYVNTWKKAKKNITLLLEWHMILNIHDWFLLTWHKKKRKRKTFCPIPSLPQKYSPTGRKYTIHSPISFFS